MQIIKENMKVFVGKNMLYFSYVKHLLCILLKVFN